MEGPPWICWYDVSSSSVSSTQTSSLAYGASIAAPISYAAAPVTYAAPRAVSVGPVAAPVTTAPVTVTTPFTLLLPRSGHDPPSTLFHTHLNCMHGRECCKLTKTMRTDFAALATSTLRPPPMAMAPTMGAMAPTMGAIPMRLVTVFRRHTGILQMK